MAKILLRKDELLDLDHALIEIYAFVRKLRDRSKVAQLIHYPSIPAALGESLTVHCASYFFGKNWTARLGLSRNDSDVILEDFSQQLAVEVKTTGQTNFQEFKSKDLDAHFLVWIQFGNRYINGGGEVNIYILRNPGHYFEPKRLKLGAFLAQIEGNPDLTHIKVGSLEALFDIVNQLEES